MNIQEMRKQMTVPELLRMADTGIYRFSDQDILNIVCKGRVHYLDMAWNLITDCDHFRWQQVIKHAPYYVLDAYEGARRKPRIIHYAGFRKPWMKPDEDLHGQCLGIYHEIVHFFLLHVISLRSLAPCSFSA